MNCLLFFVLCLGFQFLNAMCCLIPQTTTVATEKEVAFVAYLVSSKLASNHPMVYHQELQLRKTDAVKYVVLLLPQSH